MQRVKKDKGVIDDNRRHKRKSRMVCPPVKEAEKSYWIRNTCFGGFVTVMSESGHSGHHHRSRAVARLEGISKYDSEG